MDGGDQIDDTPEKMPKIKWQREVARRRPNKWYPKETPQNDVGMRTRSSKKKPSK